MGKDVPPDGSHRELERAALESLPLLHGAALQLTRNAVDAEDLVQDTYARALRHRGELRDPGAVRAWLLRIQRNIWVDHYRRRLAHPEVELVEDDDDFPAAVPAEALRTVETEDVARALDALPLPMRLVAWLCDVEGCSYEEAAAALECPVGTVRSRLFRARVRLAARLAAGRTPAAAGRRSE